MLGIHIRTQKVRENLFAAVCTLRLSQIKAGQVQKEGSKESDALLMTMEPGGFDDGLGHELVRQAWYLLSTKQAIPDVPPMPEKALDPSPSMPWETIDAINFSKVQIVFQPRQGIYPPDAKLNRVQGTVAMELTVKEDGSPESATVIEGPGPLLVYSMEYALRWRFAPLLVDGTAVKFRFRLVMNFRLN